MKETGIKLQNTDIVIKPARDASGKIEQGWQIDNIEGQNIEILMEMQAGELKEYPTLGIGIANLSLSHDTLLYKHKIRQQLSNDGFRIHSLEIRSAEQIQINATYDKRRI